MRKVLSFMSLFISLFTLFASALLPLIGHAQLSNPLSAQVLPQPESGRIERMANLPSQHVDARHVDVWLPNNFESLKAAGQRFNVIYMHDGQMLFDAQTTWNKQAWWVDKTITRLMASGQIAPTLVVGVWNNGKFRHSEYFPQKFLQLMPRAARKRDPAQARGPGPGCNGMVRAAENPFAAPSWQAMSCDSAQAQQLGG